MRFDTHAVLGTTTGRPLGDIGGIYKVISFLIGRDAYTHDLAFYGKRAAAAVRAARPDLPGEDDAKNITVDNFQACLAAWERQFGTEIDLPDSLRDSLADDKNALETLTDIVGPDKIIPVRL